MYIVSPSRQRQAISGVSGQPELKRETLSQSKQTNKNYDLISEKQERREQARDAAAIFKDAVLRLKHGSLNFTPGIHSEGYQGL